MLQEHNAEDILVSTRSIISDTGVEVSLLLVASEDRAYSTQEIKSGGVKVPKNLIN